MTFHFAMFTLSGIQGVDSRAELVPSSQDYAWNGQIYCIPALKISDNKRSHAELKQRYGVSRQPSVRRAAIDGE